MIRVRQIKVNYENDNKDVLIKKVSKRLRCNVSDIILDKIIKKSLDARGDDIFYVYEVSVIVKNEDEVLAKCKDKDVFLSDDKDFSAVISGDKVMKERPIIVGSGPSGLFAGLILAENGYNPLIIERGDEIDKRVRKVEDFFSKGILDDNSNVQFGEGGAGTFSDGKLNTLIKNENLNQKKVFETFVKFGAKEEILYENHPHIGTDLLRNIIKNMRNYMISLGASFRYNTTLTDIKIENGKVCFIEVNNKEIIPCDVLILAIGHSARDTFRMLSSHNLDMSAKPFAIGVRVEHPQELINDSQYNGKKNLPNASYKLTHTCQNGRGAYSFCMCPGGYVLNASSAKGYLVVNGMSNYKRDTKNANSAVVVTVSPKDFGNNALDGIRYQEEIEKKAYNVLNGKIPLQLFEDFLENKISNNYGNFMPVLKGDYGYANLNEILPKYICDSLKEAIINFDKKIKGFRSCNPHLLGVETRTSSPLRINRDSSFSSSIKGIYPIGEGAGYAGGITSSSIDGIKVALELMKVYKNN